MCLSLFYRVFTQGGDGALHYINCHQFIQSRAPWGMLVIPAKSLCVGRASSRMRVSNNIHNITSFLTLFSCPPQKFPKSHKYLNAKTTSSRALPPTHGPPRTTKPLLTTPKSLHTVYSVCTSKLETPLEWRHFFGGKFDSSPRCYEV